MGKRTLRILLGKLGLDGHDRGIKVIARGLMDAGFEVIYTGLRQTPPQIVHAALQEDVDLVGLSSLSGTHMHVFTEVLRELRENGLGDIPVIGGGIIPDEDIRQLKEAGISEIFLPGVSIAEIVQWVTENIRPLD